MNTRDKKMNVKELKRLMRIAMANYIASEGCSCCEGFNHHKHEKAIAELLEVETYGDKPGYRWEKYQDENVF